MLLSSLIVAPFLSLNAIEGGSDPVISTESELPSTSFYKREKRSIVNTQVSSSFIKPTAALLSLGEGWKDPFLPGVEMETSDPGNVGSQAPIGGISLPIVLSILLIYMIYRGATTSRRKNNL